MVCAILTTCLLPKIDHGSGTATWIGLCDYRPRYLSIELLDSYGRGWAWARYTQKIDRHNRQSAKSRIDVSSPVLTFSDCMQAKNQESANVSLSFVDPCPVQRAFGGGKLGLRCLHARGRVSHGSTANEVDKYSALSSHTWIRLMTDEWT